MLYLQLNIYAKFAVLDNVERVNTFARALCAEELYSTFFSGNHKFNFIIICLTIVIPFIFLAIFIIFVRNVHDDAMRTFTQPSKHGILVAMVMNGILISIGIWIFDILAVHVVVSGNHEYSSDLRGSSLNMYIVFGTLICDTLFIIPLLLSLLYIMAFNTRKLLKKVCKCNISVSMHLFAPGSIPHHLIGKKTFNKVMMLSDNDAVAVLFSAMLMSPLLCLSSHIGYIMLAWLTEPSKCTTILILFYILFVYFFLSFRKCYKHFVRSDISFRCKSFWLKPENPVTNEQEHSNEANAIELKEYVSKNEDESVEHEGEDEVKSNPVQRKRVYFNPTLAQEYGKNMEDDIYNFCCLSFAKVDKKHLNTQAFCLLFFFAFFFLCIAVMMISIIIILPLSSEELVTYLFNIFQLTVVIISTQIAYELYFGSSFSTKHVLQKFREVFASKQHKDYNEKLVNIARDHNTYSEIDEAAGAFTAELTDIIVKKFH